MALDALFHPFDGFLLQFFFSLVLDDSAICRDARIRHEGQEGGVKGTNTCFRGRGPSQGPNEKLW